LIISGSGRNGLEALATRATPLSAPRVDVQGRLAEPRLSGVEAKVRPAAA
jgi:hypothetical protein